MITETGLRKLLLMFLSKQ